MKLKTFITQENVDLYHPQAINLVITSIGITTLIQNPEESQSTRIQRNAAYVEYMYGVDIMDMDVQNYDYDGQTAVYTLK